MRVLVLFASMLIASAAVAQTTGTSSRSSSLSPSSLRTEGLNFGDDLTRIYVGDFAHVVIARDGTELSTLVSIYMDRFSTTCAGDLPKDKVEIMTQECKREAWTVNGYGVEQPGSRHCVEYRTVGTGRYADPEVHRLHTQLDAATTQAMMGGVVGAMKQGRDPANGMRKMTDVMVYVSSDIAKLLQANGCAGPALKRLQANLVRFGSGKDPIVMPGGAATLAQKGPSAEGPARDQNHQRLIDDLITEQSQAWMMNRYQAGSVRTGAQTRDGLGRPVEIVATYSFLSMGKPNTGRVRVMFLNGAPSCLYFSDLPDSCRVPSPRIASAYRNNQYAGEPGPDPAPRAVAAAPAPAPTPAPAPVKPAEVAPPAPAPLPEAARAIPSREDAQEARTAMLLDRQAAAKERRCSLLRANIDRIREMAANGPPQRAQRADAQIERAELSYAQQCPH